ncbi:DUF349 domain-containing protein [Pontibacter sp. SGAir0037]|uniref:DUF349 domain-containing protein n=1 Tax=Pontibacter sp. SGAir0037 TaxID=2571030 RepID=UPI0010CD07D4|nr:DUF349 domain-containing protein [Pontibacter sp. SGAir0037]QCR21917.1 DUF349 domain-containing protein [Pontibacter sp. SGAir0037]
MTTENRNMDTTGAEQSKPENQEAVNQNQSQHESPQEIVEKRLAEIESKNETAPSSGQEVPKEEQPEIKPELTTAAEEATTATITEIFTEAIAGETPGDSGEAANNNLTGTGAMAAESASIAAGEQRNNTFTDHHEEEEGEEEAEQIDYSSLPIEELRAQLNAVLKSNDTNKKHRAINELQREYDVKFQAERGEALERFKQEGGTQEDFDYHAPQEHQELERLLAAYREAKHHERRQTEEQRQRNLNRKKELLDTIRQLVESAETKSSNDELKKLQNEWKSIGPVPAGEAQELWDSYHALLDIFYNNRSIFFELKELDRKRNLDAKMHLIERAEALSSEESINKALQELRHLHEEWKSIGPVPNEQRDQIWDRFIQASEKVHERRRTYHEERKTVELANLDKKRGILERLQAFQNFNTDRINDWRDKTDEIQKIKEEWDAAGLVPKEFAEEINKTFWSSYKGFFQHKNQFFKSLDEQKMQNLRLKIELCEEAESLKDSTDWNSTKEKLIQLQKKWKTIGRVPDKHSDKIWQRFRSACNEFFDRKQAHEQHRGAEIEKLSAEKAAICDQISDRLSDPRASGSMNEYESFLDKWRELEKTSKTSSPKIEDKFTALLERYLERVPDLSNEERNNILLQLQVDRLKQSPDAGHKLYQKEQAVRREIQQLENDIQTLRTNIEFFARSKNADKLRAEYDGRIAEAQKRIETLNRQLRAFRA